MFLLRSFNFVFFILISTTLSAASTPSENQILAMESKLSNMINQERAKEQLPAIKNLPVLYCYAKEHT